MALLLKILNGEGIVYVGQTVGEVLLPLVINELPNIILSLINTNMMNMKKEELIQHDTVISTILVMGVFLGKS